ncbi:ribosome maturation factor RimM [Saccharicrinis sp. FJH54]|uniref:ribosome maturation factor RimM n=1 Tax=Saccharicrinis sp. FJH54 TaxID=3344665 RepID=UPI0035D51ABE
MIRAEDCIKIGKLGKAHGTKGAFNLTLYDAFFDDEDTVEYLLVLFEGYLVPFFIEELVLTDIKSGIIKFDHIHKPEDTREFVNCELYAAHDQVSWHTDVQQENELEGFSVMDKRFGNLGTVTEVQLDTPNPLLLSEHNKKIIYIPYNNSIILSIEPESRTVITEVPDGLLDIND